MTWLPKPQSPFRGDRHHPSNIEYPTYDRSKTKPAVRVRVCHDRGRWISYKYMLHTHTHTYNHIYIERDTIIFRVFYTPDNFYVLSFWSLHIHSRRRVTRCHHGSMRPGILVHCPSPCSDQAQSLQHLTQSFLCRRAVQGGNPKKMQNGRVYQHG